jgi:PIN domain nuclease of toxin-antitoxin system
MSQITVLDASAILAFLQGEPGEDRVGQALQKGPCVVSAANQADVIAKCLDRGGAPDTIQLILNELDYAVIDSTAADGMQAGWMRRETRSAGLSLGDRLCLAAAQRLKARVLTADRPWVDVAPLLGVDICCIRPEAH